MTRTIVLVLLGCLVVPLARRNPGVAAAEPVTRPNKPNILLIVADDAGFSDFGSFGGEIKTPNLDALPARGLRATNFSVAPTCSPTRSMLLTGVDNHIAGFGNMVEFLSPRQGQPGYEGHLNDRVVTVASVLRDAGYHTYMGGKWHLGEDPADWPAKRGFERDFSVLQGGGSNWSDMIYPNPPHPFLTFTRDGRLVDKLPPDYFSTTAYTDFVIDCIDQHKSDASPFLRTSHIRQSTARSPHPMTGWTGSRVSMTRDTMRYAVTESLE